MFGAREKEAEVDSTIILAATAGAFLLAGFVKGVIGLGLPTVSIGLLGLLMVPAQAAAILVVPSLVTNIWQAVVGGGLIALARRLWPMLVGICARHIRGCGVAAARRYGAGNNLAWRGPCAICGTRARQCAFQACRGTRKPGSASSWARRPAQSRWRPASSSCRGRRTSKSLQFERDKLVQALGLSFTVSTVTLALALAYAGQIRASLAGRIAGCAYCGACWDGPRAIGAWTRSGGNLPVVVLCRAVAARWPSGAARASVID